MALVTILCVDDETTGLLLRKMLLEAEGYRVLIASSGHERACRPAFVAGGRGRPRLSDAGHERRCLVCELPPYQSTMRWAKILIIFPKVRSVRWIKRTIKPTIDPDGNIDYGDMDSFTVEGEKSHLSGSWGEIEIVSDPVQVSEIEGS